MMNKSIIVVFSLLIIVAFVFAFSYMGTNKKEEIVNNPNQTIELTNSTNQINTNILVTNKSNNQTLIQNSTQNYQTSCGYNEHFGCNSISQGANYGPNYTAPVVCGCIPNSCPSNNPYLIVNGDGTFICSDTQVS